MISQCHRLLQSHGVTHSHLHILSLTYTVMHNLSVSHNFTQSHTNFRVTQSPNLSLSHITSQCHTATHNLLVSHIFSQPLGITHHLPVSLTIHSQCRSGTQATLSLTHRHSHLSSPDSPLPTTRGRPRTAEPPTSSRHNPAGDGNKIQEPERVKETETQKGGGSLRPAGEN